MKGELSSSNLAITTLSVIVLLGFIEGFTSYAVMADKESSPMPEQNCVSKGGNGGNAGNGGNVDNQIEGTPSGNAHKMDNVQGKRVTLSTDSGSIGGVTKDDSSGGRGGDGGDGGRAMTICILVAPVINLDSNIPSDPAVVLEHLNPRYASHLRMR